MNENDKKQRINTSKRRWRIKEKGKCESGNHDAIKRRDLNNNNNSKILVVKNYWPDWL